MHTLHIDITLNDIAVFRAGFAEHTEVRKQAGVIAERVQHPVGDDHSLLIELDFGSADQAEAFLGFLRDSIWKDNPAIAGTPQARILQPLDLQPA